MRIISGQHLTWEEESKNKETLNPYVKVVIGSNHLGQSEGDTGGREIGKEMENLNS